MIVINRDHWGIGGGTICQIWLDRKLPSDFPQRLLNELLAMSEPAGLSHVEAFARKGEDEHAMIASAAEEAGLNQHGKRNWDKSYYFDYVGGYRIKVTYYEDGIPVFDEDEDTDELYLLHRGKPAISSIQFDEMYGAGALENAVKLVLSGL